MKHREFIIRKLFLKSTEGISYEDFRLKCSKMSISPLAMYRGMCLQYYYDMVPYIKSLGLGEKSLTYISSDLHFFNFGTFYVDDKVVFSLNDFDEAIIANPFYDIIRLAVSLILLSRQLIGSNIEIEVKIVHYLLSNYENNLIFINDEEFSKIQLPPTKGDGVIYKYIKTFSSRESLDKNMFNKWTSNNRFRLIEGKTVKPDKNLIDIITQKLTSYHGFETKVLDVVKRIGAGTGSLGTLRFYALVTVEGKKHILDIKHQQDSPSPCTYIDPKFHISNSSIRVLEAEEFLIGTYSELNTFFSISNSNFSVREIQSCKSSYPVNLPKKNKLSLKRTSNFFSIINTLATALSESHYRASKSIKKNYSGTENLPNFIDSFITDLEEFGTIDSYSEIATTCLYYADRVEADFKIFKSVC